MITPKQSSDFIAASTKGISVIPVLVIDDVSIAGDIAKVLVDAGLPVLEVTLRTANALAVMEAMARVDGAIVAAGTVFNKEQIAQCQLAGAQFLVSPGHTDELIESASDRGIPLLPGVATASEIMRVAEKGFELAKFFPAEVNGGVNALKAFASPFPHVRFCPTGGISTSNMSDYLALPNVSVVGGSWLVTPQDIKNKDWDSIAAKAALVAS